MIREPRTSAFREEKEWDDLPEKMCERSSKKGVDITHDRAYNIHVDFKRGINSVVECHLAKVKVASPSLVSRSTKSLDFSRLFLFSALKNTNEKVTIFFVCFRTFKYVRGNVYL